MEIAPEKVSWPLWRSLLAGFQLYRKRITPKNETAFSRKAQPEPSVPQQMVAINNPPSAGPTARAMLNPAEFRATAAGNFEGGTRSGVRACHAGSFITAPTPSKNVNTSKICGVTVCVKVITPNTVAAATMELCVNRRNL